MALPASGAISLEQIRVELGLPNPINLTQAEVRALAGKPTGAVILPNDFWGKSARSVRVYVSNYQQIRVGGGLGGRYYDQITFAIEVIGGGTPSSYMWYGDVSGSGATGTFTGPIYDTNGWTYQSSGEAYCNVVIGGQTYSSSVPFTYTSGDLN